jgi:hypothetical protein
LLPIFNDLPQVLSSYLAAAEGRALAALIATLAAAIHGCAAAAAAGAPMVQTAAGRRPAAGGAADGALAMETVYR